MISLTCSFTIRGCFELCYGCKVCKITCRGQFLSISGSREKVNSTILVVHTYTFPNNFSSFYSTKFYISSFPFLLYFFYIYMFIYIPYYRFMFSSPPHFHSFTIFLNFYPLTSILFCFLFFVIHYLIKLPALVISYVRAKEGNFV